MHGAASRPQVSALLQPAVNNGLALLPGDTIGIVGGGQLGRMLAIAAARLGFQTAILDPQPDAPAFQVANHEIVAAYDNLEGLNQLASISGVITYEFENVPVDTLSQLGKSINIHPPLHALETSQDRLVEKNFFAESNIETAAFFPISDAGSLDAALKQSGGEGIVKTRRFGYDGKGQIRVASNDPQGLKTAAELAESTPCILEGLVNFECEISIIATRGTNGSIAIYDPAENVHRDGILRTSTVPASISSKTVQKATDVADRVLAELDYVGVIGIEFFVMNDGALLVNEFAPRVHNSGHWTEAACAVSQFEQHIRAIAGLPLAEAGRHSDCCMENLIGDDVDKVPQILTEPNAVLHLYGKHEVRPGRKMGHVTRLTP